MSSAETLAIPSRNTSGATTRALKAIAARIAHLAAAPWGSPGEGGPGVGGAAAAVRGIEDPPPVVGQELLVRRHDRFPRLERCQDQRPSRLNTADQLANEVALRG